MMGLTPSQAKVLAVIKRWLVAEGIGPTVREIGAESGIYSDGIVHGHLTALEDLGYIRRLPKRARAIELIEQPARYQFIPLSALTWPVTA